MDHARVVAGMDSEREGYYMVPRTSVDVGLKPKSHAQIKMIADEVRASIPEYVWAKKQLDRARDLWHDPQKLPHACSYTFLECLVWLWGEVLLHSVPLLKRELEKQYKLQPAYLSQGVFGSVAWQKWEQCFWMQYVHYQDLDRQNIGKAVTLLGPLIGNAFLGVSQVLLLEILFIVSYIHTCFLTNTYTYLQLYISLHILTMAVSLHILTITCTTMISHRSLLNNMLFSHRSLLT